MKVSQYFNLFLIVALNLHLLQLYFYLLFNSLMRIHKGWGFIQENTAQFSMLILCSIQGNKIMLLISITGC